MTTTFSIIKRDGTILDVLVDDEDWPAVRTRHWHMAGGKRQQDGKAVGLYVASDDGIYLHRLIAFRAEILPSLKTERGQRGRWSLSIDHKNGSKLDNRRSNLRLRNRNQQMRNMADDLRISNTSGYRGVSFVKSRQRFGRPWMAHVMENYKTINLGWYATAEEAAEARQGYEEATDRSAWRAVHRKEQDVGETGQRGVVLVGGRYYARAQLNGKTVSLGGAATAEESAAIRCDFLESPDKEAWLRAHRAR